MDEHRIERDALDDVLAPLGLAPTGLETRLQYHDVAPDMDSSVALALAGRTIVAAQALTTAEYWRHCGGPVQEVSVSRNDAVFALCCGLFQSSHGHDMTIASGAAAAMSGFYQARDGRWFHPMGTYPGLRDGALALLDCANTPEAIARAIAGRDALDLEEAFAAANLAGTMVRSRAEWAAHPQGQALAAAPLVTVEKIADGAPVQSAPPPRPFAGLRVLDFTHVIAGPVLTRTLAEQGADCLRLSAPGHADPQAFLIETAWGKRSAHLDFARAGDLDRMRDLVRRGDVFVQSWRPGAMEKWGLTAEELAADHPAGLIHVTVDSWGRTGPWANRKGFEQLAQAATGVALQEARDGRPCYVPTALLADYLAAYLGAAGTVAALIRRRRDGGSYRVHVSLARVTMWAQALTAPARVAGAPFPPPQMPPSIQRDSAYGLLRHLAPFARFSHSQADWALPPSPPGAHAPVWLPRDQGASGIP
ncbi:MAG: CoA transferase [Qingshengfaniella sp.]